MRLFRKILARIALRIEQRGQISMIQPRMGCCGNRRLGMIGDAQSSHTQHVEIVGTIARGQRREFWQSKLLTQRKQADALGLAAEDRLGNASGKCAILDNQFVGAIHIEPDHCGNAAGENREPARHQRGISAVLAHGLHKRARAGIKRDAMGYDIIDHIGIKPRQQRHALTQCGFKRNLTAHRAFGDGADQWLQADEIGQFINTFLPDDGGIHIGKKQRLPPSCNRLHNDINGAPLEGIASTRAGGRAIHARLRRKQHIHGHARRQPDSASAPQSGGHGIGCGLIDEGQR